MDANYKLLKEKATRVGWKQNSCEIKFTTDVQGLVTLGWAFSHSSCVTSLI